jgi:hypothetical protein
VRNIIIRLISAVIKVSESAHEHDQVHDEGHSYQSDAKKAPFLLGYFR